jgi:general secretion pathway protein K
MSRSRGSVFILVVWAVVFLAVVAGTVAAKVSADIRFASYVRAKTEARLIAISAIKKAQASLSARVDSADFLKDEWSRGTARDGGESVYRDAVLGEGRYTFLGSDGRFGMVDEERKLNLNLASADALQRLLQIAGNLRAEEAKKTAHQIVDWRDADAAALEGGTEVEYYGNKDKPFRPRNANFVLLEELKLLDRMTPALYEAVRPYVTVFGDGKVNVNTAPAPVLFALGFDESLAAKIVRYRRGADGTEGSQDDPEIVDLTRLTETLRLNPGVTMEQELAIASALSKGALVTGSRHFRIETEATFGMRTERIVCVTDKNRQTLFWRE